MMKFNKKTFELEFVDPLVCFCGGGGDSGGDEPDGVTFTSGDDYKAGDGVKISSDTLASNSTDDTYRGRNTSRAALDPFGGSGGDVSQILAGNVNARGESLGSSALANQAAQVLASGGNDFTGGNVGQVGAQAFAAPRPQARVERRPIDTSTANFVKMLAPSYMSQQAADQIAMNDANMVLPQEMYFDEKSGTYKRGADPSLDPANLAQTAADIATGNKDAYGIGSAGEFSADTARAGITNTGLTDQQMFDNIMASSEGVDRDSEVVSALSDNFLDQRGRDDLNALAGDAVDYFNNPIVKGGQFVEGLLGLPNIMTTAAGLPRFGSVGDMQIGIQQGGRLMYDNDGNPDYVVMPDGSIIGANTGSGFTGSGDDQPIQPQMNPITNQPRCPEGYSFDESVGACMPDSPERRKPISDFPANPDMFVRMTALDRAPTNVPSGFDFDAANRRFQESYAYRPQYYGRTPMDLTGFTKLR